jgi:hypothetical protein
MARQRHPKKELEEILRECEANGWRVTRDQRYFKVWCRCADKHWKTVKLSPSGANYAVNLRHWFSRQSCWED